MKIKTNAHTVELIDELKRHSRENGVALWRDIAKRLEKPSRNFAEVNLGKLARYTSDKEIIVVPGKVLGSGNIGHPITVAALAFSTNSQAAITAAKGKCITIEELVKQNPKGSGVRIIG
jgi:large subunit ribosomal protein L18e